MRLLVATDGSAHAERAAGVAARLARELREAEVTLVHVGYVPATVLGLENAAGYVDLAPLEEAVERAGREVLEKTARMFAGACPTVNRLFRLGEAASEIIRAAHETQADIIVVGARGLGHIGGLIIGSVSERVLHGAHIPVLVVR